MPHDSPAGFCEKGKFSTFYVYVLCVTLQTFTSTYLPTMPSYTFLNDERIVSFYKFISIKINKA